MRSSTIIAYFPRLGVAVLGGALATAGYCRAAHAAPAKAGPAAAAPATAPAEGPDAKTKAAAREAYGAGEKAYGAQDYKTAYAEFKKAYDLIPSINAQFRMAMCLSFGEDLGAAYEALVTVASSPDSSKLGDEKLATLQARIDEIKKTPAVISVTSTPPGGVVSLDGATQPGMTPTKVNAAVGTHKLSIWLDGYEQYQTEIGVKPGEKVERSAELIPVAAPAKAAAAPAAAPVPVKPAEPPPAKEEHSMLPAYITLGVAVVGAGVGTVFGIKALGDKSDYDKNPTSAGADRAERDALIADMSFGIGLTLGITGVVLLLSSDSGDAPAPAAAHLSPRPAQGKLMVAPIVSSTVGGAAARLTF